MSHIKQVFLDLDGPVLDGKDKHYHCYRSILERFGFKPIDIDEYWEKKRALVNRRDLLKISGAEAIYDDFLAAWLLLIESPNMLALDKVQAGAVDCLRSWKERGIELTLVTMRKNKQALEAQLNSTGLHQHLDAVLVCDHADSGVGKADAVRNLFQGKVKKGGALWIGDTEADWEAAKSLGCDVVLLSNGLRNEAYLKTLEGAVVRPSITLVKDEVLEKRNVN
jgi:phosphoglycolate phosphatase-like HAD superfamily hydrolase